jgi:hypothetical protein
MVDILSVFQVVNMRVQILVGGITMFEKQQVDQVEISSIFHLLDNCHESLCHSGHSNPQDWFKH